MRKKVLAITLAAVLMLSLLPATALAADEYNDHDVAAMTAFLNQDSAVSGQTNAQVLGCSVADPSTWESKGIFWVQDPDTSEKHINALHLSGKSIAGSLNLSDCTYLGTVNCPDNSLTSIDVSNCPALTQILVNDNPLLTTLNMTGSAALTQLNVYNSQLSSVNVSGCLALSEIDCHGCEIETLDLTGCSALTEVHCEVNKLTSLNVGDSPLLTYLDCTGNRLAAIDVSHNTGLTNLSCDQNQLTSLDLSHNNAVSQLMCANNALTSLNLSGAASLTVVMCGNNQLTALDVSASSNLMLLMCADNPLTSVKGNNAGHSLSIKADGNGYVNYYLAPDMGELMPKGHYASAAANSPAVFYNWTQGGAAVGTEERYDFASGTDYDLTAHFLSLSSCEPGNSTYVGGHIALTPTIEGGEWSFDSAYFTREGNVFTALKEGTSTVTYTLNGKSTSCAVVIAGSLTVSISSSNAAYGSVSGGGAYPDGATATLTAIPANGCRFVRWTENGTEVSTSVNYSFTVTGNRTLVAVFEKDASNPAPPTDVIPVGISCTKADVTIYGAANGSITVTASGGNSGTYEYAINGSWQSSGTFGGIAAGTYTAAVRDAGNKENTATCSVTVGQPSYMGNVLAKKLPSKPLAGTALTIIPPAAPKGYTTTGITYSSSNPSIAAVDANGNVTFLAGGKTTIITKVVSQMTDKKGKVKTKTTIIKKTITVKQPVAAVSLNVGSATIARKGKVKLTSSIAPATASSKKLKWTTSNPKVATVSGAGVVTGKAGGTAVITCTATDGSGVSASCTVNVTPIYPTGIKMSKAALTVKAGKAASLKATILPKTTDFKTVAWASSNPAVATVDAKGKVKAVASGTAVITAATSSGQTAACTVTVP